MTMTKESTCCQGLAQGGPSPFDITMLGWYDGLTSGMAKCRGCGRTYHFDLLTWDEEHEARLYGFKEVSATSHDAVALLLASAPSSPERAVELGDLVTLRVRDALSTSMERKLLIVATDLTAFVQSAQTVDFPRWKSLLAVA
jgi:hypothetical protein